MRHYTNVFVLESSGVKEVATITRISRSGTHGGSAFYFTTEIDSKIYRTTAIRGRYRVGNEIIVKFNDDRTLFFVTNFCCAHAELAVLNQS